MLTEDYLKGNATLVLKKGDSVLISEKSGIRPMLDYIGEGMDLKGYSAADKIVGKAAAMLFIASGIASVYAEVLSIPAKELLIKYGIPVKYKTLTERIINRRGDGLCPMEEAVLNIDDVTEAYGILKNKSDELRGRV